MELYTEKRPTFTAFFSFGMKSYWESEWVVKLLNLKKSASTNKTLKTPIYTFNEYKATNRLQLYKKTISQDIVNRAIVNLRNIGCES
ncbi:hypothetical protein A8709_13665 [Paenibacillus pectinilyticus]|uniref:Uncharacterized protein n=1 Tax=Paenibacillus pectinilyticus TaxID=512399 RepID=A0A1C1A3L7_9BACL|nr:hypothetical protein A8709_13665 [Paenibacillus pectinilyticus]